MTEKDERHFCISVAGHTIAIDALHSDVFSHCRDYLCDLDPEVRVFIDEKDIEYERSEMNKVRSSQKEGYIETIAVYRKISEIMLDLDSFLMHGAVVATGGEAYMFTATSGTGKTTHIKKWLKNLDDAFVVNGDKPLIKMTDTQAIACGTPWCGKERLGSNTMVPLKAIVLMERGEDNAMEEISFGKAFTFLLQQTYWPADTIKRKKTLEFLSQLSGKVRFFMFHFNNLKDNSFSVAYQALIGNKV